MFPSLYQLLQVSFGTDFKDLIPQTIRNQTKEENHQKKIDISENK